MSRDLEGLAAREAARVIQAPQGGAGDVWAEIIEHLDCSPSLKRACEARRTFGLEKYGVPLGYGDGRGLVDQLQESLDLAAYAWRDGSTHRALQALFMAQEILVEMEMEQYKEKA